jgi:hypothetical protein
MKTVETTIGIATQKLISELAKHSITKVGNVCTAKDGQLYRYDKTELKYNNAAYWLVQLFNKAAEENGAKHQKQFFAGNYSFAFDRAKFKGQPDGKIGYTELILL